MYELISCNEHCIMLNEDAHLSCMFHVSNLWFSWHFPFVSKSN